MSISTSLIGSKVDEHQAVATTTVHGLLDLGVGARAFLPRAKNSPQDQFIVDQLADLHDLIQRDLSGQKATNAKTLLRDYIVEEWLTGDGVLPPFVLLFGEKLQDLGTDVPGVVRFELPIGLKAIFLDGESRHESVLQILEDPEVSAETKRDLLSRPVALHIFHGLTSTKTAAKYFGDINGKGVKVNPNLVMARDYKDPWATIALEIFEAIDVPLELTKRQVGPKGLEVITALQARTMVGAIALGVGAISYGAKRMPDEDIDFRRVRDASQKWIRQVFDRFPADEDYAETGAHPFKDRSLVLRSVPILVCLGALGRPFYDGDKEGQVKAAQALSDSGIDWSVGEHWVGVVGKISPATERFSVGSGKEYAYAAWRALTDPSDAGYRQIRHKS